MVQLGTDLARGITPRSWSREANTSLDVSRRVGPNRSGRFPRRSICPRFFRHENWSSFSRMLNMYQFHKLPMSRSQERVTGYEHRFFYRGGADELYRVVRKKKAAHGGDPAKARATAEVTPYSSPRLSADPLRALADTAQAAQRRSPPSREPRPPTGNAGTRLPTIMRALDGTGAHGVLPTNRGDARAPRPGPRKKKKRL